MHLRRPGRPPRAFTLIEALVATSILGFAGSALLLGLASSLDTTTRISEETVAAGLAQQLIDEIAGKQYSHDPALPRAPLGPTAWEAAGTGRQRYNDIGDYHGISQSPPQDSWGNSLTLGNSGVARHPSLQAGAYFTQWRQQVEVYYVDLGADGRLTRKSSGQSSDYRAVEVLITRTDAQGIVHQLARAFRVFAYVPAS